MFDVRAIQACLFGRIGFNPERDTELAKIDSDLRETRSGLYWEEGHALITLENLQAVSDDEDESVYPVYAALTLYKIGDLVTDASKIYRKLTGAPAGTPVSDTAAWTETSVFGVWLRNKVNGTIKKVISDIYTRKKKGKTIKSILEDSFLFDGAGNIQDKEIKQGRFLGYQLMFRGTDGLTAVIDRISTQFTMVFPDPLTLYLYYTGSDIAVATIQITPGKVNTVQWHDIEKTNISYSDESSGVGGAWFLGYYEDDLPFGAQALNRSAYNFQNGPCSGCGNNSYFVWSQWFKWISIVPFAVPAGQLMIDRNIWDWRLNQYYYESKTWGINLHFSIACNTTALICRQQEVFDQALLKQFAVDMLHEIAYSTRINRIQEKTQQKAMFELDDRDTSTSDRASNKTQKGLKSELRDVLAATDFDFSDLGSVCAPCDQRKGVTVKAF